MPDTKITDLSALTGADSASGDVTVVVDVSDPTMSPTSGTNKKMTLDELANAVATKLGVVGRDVLWDAKGDLAVGTGANTASRLAVGSAGTAPIAQSSASTGLAYGYAASSQDKYTLPTGALAATQPRSSLYFGSQTLTSGRIQVQAIVLPKDLTVTSISFQSSSIALASGSNQWFGIFDNSRNMLRLTTDDTSTAWSTYTTKTLNLTSTYTTTYEGLYYLGILVVASTVPNLTAANLNGSSPSNVLAPLLYGYADTGLTNPASCPSTLAALSAVGSYPFAWVS